MHAHWLRTSAVILAVLTLLGSAVAQEDTAPTREDRLGFTSPRSTMRGYFAAARHENWDLAAEHLDLSGVPSSKRAERGPIIARQLKGVLDRTLWINLDDVNNTATGDADDGQPEGRDLIGTIHSEAGRARVYVKRVQSEDGTLEWKIARSTVDEIARLYEEFGSAPALAKHLPPILFRYRVFDTAPWQWLALLALVGGAALVGWIGATVVLFIARMIARRTKAVHDDAIVELSIGPVRMILAVMVFSGGLHALWLPLGVLRFTSGAGRGFLVVAVTWLAVRLVSVISRIVQLRMAARGERLGTSAVPLVRRVVNGVIVLLSLIVIAGAFGVNVTGLVAGLGVGGLAVALAAQKSLENLFGGFTLIVDQPVHVGDFCKFGDRVGVIEEIGLRSTRIRTLDRTLVTVPNAEFSTMQIENYAQRDRIWLSTTIGVRYETTPDQLRFVMVEMKKMLLAHPKIDPSPARVRFAAFGAFSLDIDIFAYVRTTDYNEFLAVREDIFLRIMDIIAASGTGFAFPSQTIYTAPDDGVDAERTQAAEQEVARWRASGELSLPDPSATQVSAVEDTLDYPPKGSVKGPSEGPA